MGRQSQHTTVVASGERVGYSLVERPGNLRVRFTLPGGVRVERSTGCSRKGEARAEAERLVARGLRLGRHVPRPPYAPAPATWIEALTDLARTPDLRPATVKGYKCAVDAMTGCLPGLSGPAAVTPALAARFPGLYLAAPYRKGAGGADRHRTASAANSALRHLKSLWAKHWVPKGFAAADVWAAVPPLNAARGRRVRVPPESAVGALFDYLGTPLPRLAAPPPVRARQGVPRLPHARTLLGAHRRPRTRLAVDAGRIDQGPRRPAGTAPGVARRGVAGGRGQNPPLVRRGRGLPPLPARHLRRPRPGVQPGFVA